MLRSPLNNYYQINAGPSLFPTRNTNTALGQIQADTYQYNVRKPSDQNIDYWKSSPGNKRKPSATYIPTNPNTSQIEVDEATNDFQPFSFMHSSPEKTKTLVSLSDYTNDSINLDATEEHMEDYTYEECAGEEHNAIGIATNISNSKRNDVASGKKDRPNMKQYGRKYYNSKNRRRMKALQQQTKQPARKSRGIRGQDLNYRPPHRIASMTFLPRLLPFRHRRMPIRFSDLVHWDTLTLRTVIERNSRYKNIIIFRKSYTTKRVHRIKERTNLVHSNIWKGKENQSVPEKMLYPKKHYPSSHLEEQTKTTKDSISRSSPKMERRYIQLRRSSKSSWRKEKLRC